MADPTTRGRLGADANYLNNVIETAAVHTWHHSAERASFSPEVLQTAKEELAAAARDGIILLEALPLLRP